MSDIIEIQVDQQPSIIEVEVSQLSDIIEVQTPGIQGPIASEYTHIQTTASNSWVISHNLGFKPSVSIVSGGGLEIEGCVIHIDINNIRIDFNKEITGTVRLD